MRLSEASAKWQILEKIVGLTVQAQGKWVCAAVEVAGAFLQNLYLIFESQTHYDTFPSKFPFFYGGCCATRLFFLLFLDR